MTTPRELWAVLETLHDVTYFAPRARAAHEAAGLRGLWRGYVATRAAPLGAAGPGLVTAVFHNFAPSFLARTLPAVWQVVPPERALAARADGAVAALRAHLPGLEPGALTWPAGVLHRIVGSVPWAGRPLGAANAALRWPGEPLAALWQAATTVREHRGDGHVAVLVSEGIDGVEAHVLRDAADDRLAARGLVTAGGLRGDGACLREHIDRRTDDLGSQAFAAATAAELDGLAEVLRPFAPALVPGVVPSPNPVGSPRP